MSARCACADQPGDQARLDAALEHGSETIEPCVFCGEHAFVDLLEYWPDTREFELDYCCEANRDGWVDDMRAWTGEQWATFFAERAGVVGVRSVGGEPSKRDAIGVGPESEWLVDRGITIVESAPIGKRLRGRTRPGQLCRDELREFVRQFHAHAGERPPAGMLWGYGIFNGPPADPVYDGRPRFSAQEQGRCPLNLVRWPANLIGVVLVGRPWARKTCEKAALRGERIADVTRVALDRNLPAFLTYRASSAVYARAAEDARTRGFSRIQTFTLASESGMSLRYARWKPDGQTQVGREDRASSSARTERAAELRQAKTRWVKNLA